MSEGIPEVDDAADIDARFEEHVGPFRDRVVTLLEISAGLRKHWGDLPSPDAVAMREMAEESVLAGCEEWGPAPATNTHNVATLLMTSAEDLIQSMCELLEAGRRTPTFAHIVLARAAIEHCARAAWLAEAGIGLRQRVARGVNERLESLARQAQLPPAAGTREHANRRIRALLQDAEKLGFRVIPAENNRPPAIEERRPSYRRLVRDLLGRRGDDDLGPLAYSYYSGVAHGDLFGLSQSMSREAPGMPEVPGVRYAALMVSSSHVVGLLTAVALAFIEAAATRFELMGWDTTEFMKATIEVAREARLRNPEPASRS